jgi:hypothetical protein
MKILNYLVFFVVLFGIIWFSFHPTCRFINNKSQKRVEFIANDLRIHGEHSVYFKRSNKWVKVCDGVWICSDDGLQLRFYIVPLGPKKVLDVKTNEWSAME